MNEKRFQPHTPEGMFIVRVEHIVKHDTREKMHYEYTIARAAGIGAVTVFSRFFRRTHRCTPCEWRYRHKKSS